MSETDTLKLFNEANDLWYNQGLTLQALERYQDVVNSDPTDPVALYQFARALLAFSRFEEARVSLTSAQRFSNRLTTYGNELLIEEIERMSDHQLFQFPLPFEESDLDAERLEQKDLTPDLWLHVADAAQERGMYGLAVYALRHSQRDFRVHELDEDEREMGKAASAELNRLQLMRSEEAQDII
jgi:hypothetical protein